MPGHIRWGGRPFHVHFVSPQVTSPRSPSHSLVRGGRVVAFRFPCPSAAVARSVSSVRARDGSGSEPEEDDEPVPDDTPVAPEGTGEVEQSGLALEAGRAYRGYVWVASRRTTVAEVSDEDEPTLKAANATASPPKFASRSTSSNGSSNSKKEEDGAVVMVEVWLRYRDPSARRKGKLLARITDSAFLAGIDGAEYDDGDDGTVAVILNERVSIDDDNGGVRAASTQNSSSRSSRGSPSQVKSAGRLLGARWKRVEFGFIASKTSRLDCE